MNHKRLVALLGMLLVSGTLILMGSIEAQAPWPDPPNRVKGSKLLGQKRAGVALNVIKKEYPSINIDVGALSKAIMGSNLMEAIRNKGLLGWKQDACAEARELLPQACEGVSVEGKSLFVGSVEDIAKKASCQAVEGLLEYCTGGDAGDQAKAQDCELFEDGNGELIGFCGCDLDMCWMF